MKRLAYMFALMFSVLTVQSHCQCLSSGTASAAGAQTAYQNVFRYPGWSITWSIPSSITNAIVQIEGSTIAAPSTYAALTLGTGPNPLSAQGTTNVQVSFPYASVVAFLRVNILSYAGSGNISWCINPTANPPLNNSLSLASPINGTTNIPISLVPFQYNTAGTTTGQLDLFTNNTIGWTYIVMMQVAPASGGSISIAPDVKSAGTYYVQGSVSTGGGMAPVILQTGDTYSLNVGTNTAGYVLAGSLVGFPTTAPLKFPRSLGTAMAGATLYTAPTTRGSLIFALNVSMLNLGVLTSAGAGAIGFTGDSVSNLTFSGYLIAPGQTLGATTLIISGVQNANTHANFAFTGWVPGQWSVGVKSSADSTSASAILCVLEL